MGGFHLAVGSVSGYDDGFYLPGHILIVSFPVKILLFGLRLFFRPTLTIFRAGRDVGCPLSAAPPAQLSSMLKRRADAARPPSGWRVSPPQ
jgi:hypothetical protein